MLQTMSSRRNARRYDMPPDVGGVGRAGLVRAAVCSGLATAFFVLLFLLLGPSAAASDLPGVAGPAPDVETGDAAENESSASAVAGNTNATVQDAAIDAPVAPASVTMQNDTTQTADAVASVGQSAPVPSGPAAAPADPSATAVAENTNATVQDAAIDALVAPASVTMQNATTQTADAVASVGQSAPVPSGPAAAPADPSVTAVVENTDATVQSVTQIGGETSSAGPGESAGSPLTNADGSSSSATAPATGPMPTDKGTPPVSLAPVASPLPSLGQLADVLVVGSVAPGIPAAALTGVRHSEAGYSGAGLRSTTGVPTTSAPGPWPSSQPGFPAQPVTAAGMVGSGSISGGAGGPGGLGGVAVLAGALALAVPRLLTSLTSTVASMTPRLYFPVPVGPA